MSIFARSRTAAIMVITLAAFFLAGCPGEETIVDPPVVVVSAVTPSAGATTGGARVTIYGAEFYAGAVVRFGVNYGADVQIVGSGELTVLTPPGLNAGAVDVTVTSPGHAAGTLTNGYTYVSWWYSSWAARVPVTVTGSTAGDLTDFQVRVVLPYDGDMRPDFTDLRFSVYDGTTEVAVPFWREYATPGVEGAFWVRVPSLLASPATVTVYAYYDNDTAPDGSDFDGTFDKEYGDTGLLGLWHMDEGSGDFALDSSGNANHGWMQNFDLPFGWVGHDGGGWDAQTGVRFTVGDCLHFDGETASVDAGAFPPLGGAAAFSVEAWVRGDTATVGHGAQTIASQWAHRDTDFADSANWTAYNASTSPTSAYGGYRGSCFDGRHIYFVAHYTAGTNYHGEFLRYDTHGNYTSSGSWQKYDFGNALQSATKWEQKLDLGSTRESLRCAAVNGKVYAIGGNSGGALTNCDEYDPSGNTWTGRAPLPAGKYDFGIAVVNNLIYCIGGNGPLATVNIYDPALNSWTAGAGLPTARSGLACAVWNGLIYCIGGDDGTGAVGTVEIYDPAADSWTTGPDMPTPRSGLGCATVRGRICALGGFSTSTLRTVESLNPVSGVWTTRNNMPDYRQDFGIGVIENHIFVSMGIENGSWRGETYEYDPESDRWLQRDWNWWWYRDRVGSCVLNGGLYVVAGRSSGPQPRQNVDIYFPSKDYYSPTSTTLRYYLDGFSSGIYDGRYVYFIPYARSSYQHGTFLRYDTQGGFADFSSWTFYDPGHWGVGSDPDGYQGATFDGRYIYCAPYHNDSAYHGEVLRFDTQGEFKSVSSYTTFDPSSNGVGTTLARGYHGAVYDGRNVYFLPHHNGSPNYFGEILKYDTHKTFTEPGSWDTYNSQPDGPVPWVARTPVPTARHWVADVTVGNRIYVLGGWISPDTRNYNHEYSPLTDTWRTRAGMPWDRREFDAAELNGNIYVPGGREIDDSPVVDTCHATMQVYRPGLNSWTTSVASMNTARAAHCVEAVDGKVYAISGFTNPPGTLIDTVEEYDPVANTWTYKTPMPGPGRWNAASAVHDGYIYIIGGYAGGVQSSLYRYDPSNNSWTTLTSMPASTNGFRAVVIGKRIYVVGGSGTAANTAVFFYDIDQDIWYTGYSMPTGRYAHGLGVVNGKIYCVGGWTGADTAVCEEYDPTSTGGFINGVFDGRYLYCSVYYPGFPGNPGTVLRYDTRKDFKDPMSYKKVGAGLMGANFNDGTTWHNTGRLFGANFDGRFIYFTQYYSDIPSGRHRGQVVRYDTEAEFDSPTAWKAYNPHEDGVAAWELSLEDSVFDGRYIYCSPYRNEANQYQAEAIRYDTAAPGCVFKLEWLPPDPAHGFTGAPVGPRATILTADGHFTAASSLRIEAGGWHHVAATYDGATLSLYIDGALAKAMPATGALNTSGLPLLFGNQAGANARFKGQMDEMRVYSRALAAGEVKAHSERRKFADPEPAVGTAGTEEHK